MIKIDLSTFNLVCTRDKDGKRFIYKYKTKFDLRLVDILTGEILDITVSVFRRNYSPDKKVNGKNSKRPAFMNFGRKRIA